MKLDTCLGEFKVSRLFRDNIFSSAALFQRPTPTQNKMAASASMSFWSMDLEFDPAHVQFIIGMAQASVVENVVALPPATGVAMSQSYHSACSDDVEHPVCTECRAPMVITHIEELCLGRHRRIFECHVCGTVTTQWAG